MEDKIKKILENWDKISDNHKIFLKPDKYQSNIETLKNEEHFVILLLGRQKPSVEECYDFNEERIGLTRSGKVIWGFDSGCSCPTPWNDSYPDCYKVSKEWKEFIVNINDFDVDAEKEVNKKIDEILKEHNLI